MMKGKRVRTMRRGGFEPLVASFLRHRLVRVVVALLLFMIGLLPVERPRGGGVRSMGTGLLSVKVGA
jgi:hypothetical protein